MKFHVLKFLWGIRALIYKPFSESLKLPSYIGKPIFISGLKRICIGRRVRIFPHVRLETLGTGSISIEDNVYIGQNCHITAGGSKLTIGTGTSIMANVCVTNIDHLYFEIDKPILEQPYKTRETIIGKNCFIGHGAVIQAGAKLGDHVIIGANSVVMRGSYPDNCVLVGAPAIIKKKYKKGIWLNEN